MVQNIGLSHLTGKGGGGPRGERGINLCLKNYIILGALVDLRFVPAFLLLR